MDESDRTCCSSESMCGGEASERSSRVHRTATLMSCDTKDESATAVTMGGILAAVSSGSCPSDLTESADTACNADHTAVLSFERTLARRKEIDS